MIFNLDPPMTIFYVWIYIRHLYCLLFSPLFLLACSPDQMLFIYGMQCAVSGTIIQGRITSDEFVSFLDTLI